MAVVFKLVRSSTELSLLAGAGSGWRAGVWNPKVGTPAYGRRPLPVVESIDCIVDRGSHDDLATSLQAMDEMREGAARYFGDRQEPYPVWLHAKMNNETGERRALVREVGMEWLSAAVDVANEAAINDARVRLKIEREGVWEATAQVSMPAVTPSAAAAVVYDYTASPGADVVGDAPARVSLLRIEPATASIGTLWVGLRSANKHGTLANFIPIWECEDTDCVLGTTDTVGRTTDATASPGGGGNTKVQVTAVAGEDTWAKELSMALGDFTANYADNAGTFLWLLRTQVSAGTWEVQLRFGYEGWDSDSMVRGPMVEVSSTSWNYQEVGISSIPAQGLQFAAGLSDSQAEVEVWARRTSGAGTLDLDCLCPMPIDEGFAKMVGDASLAGNEVVNLIETARGVVAAAVCSNVGVLKIPLVPQVYNFRLPPGDGRMVIVFQRSAAVSVLGDQIVVNYGNIGKYYACWYNLRGAE